MAIQIRNNVRLRDLIRGGKIKITVFFNFTSQYD